MNLIHVIIAPIFLSIQADAARLHKVFQFLDGFRSEHALRGYLHLGEDYAVFLRAPKPHDRFLVYELYEAKKADDETASKPRVVAVSKVPVDYMKEQLTIYRQELYQTKYVDENVVPGTRVRSLREWQIQQALNDRDSDGKILNDKPNVLRTIV